MITKTSIETTMVKELRKPATNPATTVTSELTYKDIM